MIDWWCLLWSGAQKICWNCWSVHQFETLPWNNFGAHKSGSIVESFRHLNDVLSSEFFIRLHPGLSEKFSEIIALKLDILLSSSINLLATNSQKNLMIQISHLLCNLQSRQCFDAFLAWRLKWRLKLVSSESFYNKSNLPMLEQARVPSFFFRNLNRPDTTSEAVEMLLDAQMAADLGCKLSHQGMQSFAIEDHRLVQSLESASRPNVWWVKKV